MEGESIDLFLFVLTCIVVFGQLRPNAESDERAGICNPKLGLALEIKG